MNWATLPPYAAEMKWEMDGERMELATEKICDLHDRISDTIHTLSKSNFLRSTAANNCAKTFDEKKSAAIGSLDEWKRGYVYVKGFKLDEDDATAAEVRSLNSIRTALEDLEEQLEFLHTIQSQQRAERDAAIARLEQSRIILAMRLSEFHGRKYKVIEEAMAFVGDVSDNGQIAPPGTHNKAKKAHGVVHIFLSSLTLVKKLFGLDRLVSALGNATLFTASVLVLLGMQQVSMNNSLLPEGQFHREAPENHAYKSVSTSYGDERRPLDVFSARG
ncbi:plastid division protein PDV1-like [Wolffia australiana]